MISRNSPDLDQKYETLEVAKTTVNNLNDRIKNLKEQIKKSVEEIEQISEFLGTIPDIESLETERVKLKSKQTRLESTLASRKNQFFSLIKQGFILLQSKKAIEYSEEKIKVLRTNGQLPPRFDRNYLLEFISNSKCGICGTSLDDLSKRRISELLSQIDYSTQTTHQLSKLETSLRYLLEDLDSLGERLTGAKVELDGTNQDLDDVIDRLHQIDLIVGSYSDKELIKQKYDNRRNHEILRAENLRVLGNVEAQLTTAQKDLEVKENALNKALKAVNQSEQAKKKQEFLEQVYSVAKAAKYSLLFKTKDSIQELTTKTFLRLIWKKNTYREVVLDENYSLSLKQMNGMESLGSVSAAEGALLALSFTLAIHNASGFSSPLIIDTPIARISDINKDNFAKVLLEISKEKQLILFLTPDEYTPKIQQAFEPSINTKYYLKLSQDETITTLEGR
jgi:DNA sulfur modification protein DndD